METSPPAAILIHASRPTAQRWAEMLHGPQYRVWLSPEEVPDDVLVELVVTDRSPAEDALPPLPTGLSDADASRRPEAGPVGLVRIGTPGPADVNLPADVSGRELRLACGLLAEIVRLRRRQQSGAERSRRLVREALTDPLTGLPNRRAWDQALAERLQAAAGRAGRLCVAILDLDHFKRVNDAHGHPAGDEVLRAVGRALREGLRQDDFVARLGGDEFGLLLWVSDATAAAAVVDRVRRRLPAALAETPAEVVTASAGYQVAGLGAAEQPSPLPPTMLRTVPGEGPGVRAGQIADEFASGTPTPDPTSPHPNPLPQAGEGVGRSPALPCPDELFAAADAALREAKRAGRDRTVGAQAQPRASARG